jgi:hypothetical protein
MKVTYLESERLFKVGNLTAGISVKCAAAARNNDDRRSASSIRAAMQRHAAAAIIIAGRHGTSERPCLNEQVLVAPQCRPVIFMLFQELGMSRHRISGRRKKKRRPSRTRAGGCRDRERESEQLRRHLRTTCMPNGTAAVLGRAGEKEERLARVWSANCVAPFHSGSHTVWQRGSLRRSNLRCLRDGRSLESGRLSRGDGNIRK